MARRSPSLQVFRRTRGVFVAALSALGSFALASSPGCGTDAHGVEDCREIETARCAAAVPCGIVTDQPRCENYYRDHCLHGLPGNQPQQATVDLCVNAINLLGACAKRTGAATELKDCESGIETHDATTACEVIQFPEKAYACSFLSATPPPPIESAGGQAGVGGDGG
ncbi:MAG TPA: hypothetical protein VNN72_17560 [Polyangiaceae bacterium]|nr:hypothetical protein [Polyangiaceae bacterium]